MACVWAYKKLPELNNEVGYVGVDQATADRLIASGDAEDPFIGAHHLKHIGEHDAVQTSEKAEAPKEKVTKGYKTKVLVADDVAAK